MGRQCLCRGLRHSPVTRSLIERSSDPGGADTQEIQRQLLQCRRVVRVRLLERDLKRHRSCRYGARSSLSRSQGSGGAFSGVVDGDRASSRVLRMDDHSRPHSLWVFRVTIGYVRGSMPQAVRLYHRPHSPYPERIHVPEAKIPGSWPSAMFYKMGRLCRRSRERLPAKPAQDHSGGP